MKSPSSPTYANEKDTPILDSHPIFELPIMTERDPVELPASNQARTEEPVHQSNPAHPHALAWAEAGAERDEVDLLGNNFAVKELSAPKQAPTERESWASAATATSIEAVVGVEGLGLRN